MRRSRVCGPGELSSFLDDCDGTREYVLLPIDPRGRLTEPVRACPIRGGAPWSCISNALSSWSSISNI